MKLILLTIFQFAFYVVEAPYIDEACNNASYFQTGSHRHRHMFRLFKVLYEQTPRSGFHEASIGTLPDDIHGQALCRGGVSVVDCENCLNTATDRIPHGCRSAVIWLDDCLLRYAAYNFSGHIETHLRCYSPTSDNVSMSLHNPPIFESALAGFLEDISGDAANNSSLLFATRRMVVMNESLMIIGMAQCTRDLLFGDCRTCLAFVSNGIKGCCSRSAGGQFLTGSCFIMYTVHSVAMRFTAALPPVASPWASPPVEPPPSPAPFPSPPVNSPPPPIRSPPPSTIKSPPPHAATPSPPSPTATTPPSPTGPTTGRLILEITVPTSFGIILIGIFGALLVTGRCFIGCRPRAESV